MAPAPSNEERVRLGEARAVTPKGRGIDSRGIPSTQSSGSIDRPVTYRFEDAAGGAKTGRTAYPFWASVRISNDSAAPEKMVLNGGVVAYRAEPDWYGPPEAPLSAPPLVQAPWPPPRRHKHAGPKPTSPQPKPVPIEPKPLPIGPLVCQPGYMLTRSGKSCTETPELLKAREDEWERQEFWRGVDDYTDATLGDGFENAAKVSKYASLIPGPAGSVFKLAHEFFETAHAAYEGAKLLKQLIMEMKQSDALVEGSRELAKKGEDAFTKLAEKKLDMILKRKGIVLPDALKKQVIKKAREYFDKKIRDPALEKGKEEFEKRMDPKERDRSLWQQWKRGLTNNGTDLPGSSF